jgi:hypothetical protein
MVDVTQIAQTAKTHWWSGTNEIQLARAARAFECDLVLERRSDAEDARKVLTKHLREQTPVLLCVDEWSHWITVVRAEDRRFVVVDSQDDPLLSVRTWPQLRNWWRYHDTDYATDKPPTLYDLMAVSPRFRTTVKADFSVERVKFLRRPENRRLARHWNEYLEDLLEICKPPSVRIAEPLSMGEFLRRHQELLLTRVVYWHGDVSRDEVSASCATCVCLRDLRPRDPRIDVAPRARRPLDRGLAVGVRRSRRQRHVRCAGCGSALGRDQEEEERQALITTDMSVTPPPRHLRSRPRAVGDQSEVELAAVMITSRGRSRTRRGG